MLAGHAGRLGYAMLAGVNALVAGLFVLAAAWLLGRVGWPLPSLLLLLVLSAAGFWQAGTVLGWGRRGLALRRGYERLQLFLFAVVAAMAVLVTVGIVLSVAAEAWRFFQYVGLGEFLFGLEWSPQIAIREDQAGASGRFGFVPLLVGTLLISTIAMLLAVPLGLLAAIFLAEFADRRWRARLKPALEFLAGVPTVVYGFFAIAVLGPALNDLGSMAGLMVSSESALAAGLMIGVMIVPMITSLAEDALGAVPEDLRHGSLALGSTRYESVLRVIVPAALPGIVAGILLALSRAIGETMIVVMAAGLSANLTANPLESVTAITVQIVTLLTGDQEFDDPKTLAAFALGLVLFVFTMLLNAFGLWLVRRYHENYE